VSVYEGIKFIFLTVNSGPFSIYWEPRKTIREVLTIALCSKHICVVYTILGEHSSDGIATGYGMEDRKVGVRVPVGSRIFSLHVVPPSLLSNGYRGLSGRGVKLTPHHLVPRSRKVELYLHSPIRRHGIVLKQLSTGTTLPYLISAVLEMTLQGI
jgi:hypothetical protein